MEENLCFRIPKKIISYDPSNVLVQQTQTEYMKQTELTVSLNVTHTLLFKTRRCGNCSDECYVC